MKMGNLKKMKNCVVKMSNILNNKTGRIIFIVLIFIVLISNVASAALEIEIKVKPSFTLGEIIFFNYTIISSTNESIKYFPHIRCPISLYPSFQFITADLIANQPLTGTYLGINVTRKTEPQECTAYVSIISPAELQQTVSKNFTIVTNPSFDFSIKLCKDSSCSEKAKIFVKGENIYLDYESEVANPEITATLTLPDKTIQQITLPYSIKAGQIGTYTLEASASKEGYKTASVKEQFAVIEKEAEIKLVSQCNANGICEPEVGENSQTCPQDCVEKKEAPPARIRKKIFTIIGFCFGVIIAILVFLLGKKSKDN